MPHYDYFCPDCNTEFEIFHSMAEPARTRCEACGGNRLEKRLGTGAGVIFSGGGFYETDYKRAGEKKTECCKKESSNQESCKKDKPAANSACCAAD